PGDHPQRRRLAATRRAEQHHEAPAGRLEADVVDGRGGAPVLAHVFQRKRAHVGVIRNSSTVSSRLQVCASRLAFARLRERIVIRYSKTRPWLSSRQLMLLTLKPCAAITRRRSS